MAVSIVRNTVSVPVAASGSTAASGNGEGTPGASSFADVLALLQAQTGSAPPGSMVAATEDAAPESVPEDVTVEDADNDVNAVDVALESVLAALQQVPPIVAPAPAAAMTESLVAVDAAANVAAAVPETLDGALQPVVEAVTAAVADATAPPAETTDSSPPAMTVPVEAPPARMELPQVALSEMVAVKTETTQPVASVSSAMVETGPVIVEAAPAAPETAPTVSTQTPQATTTVMAATATTPVQPSMDAPAPATPANAYAVTETALENTAPPAPAPSNVTDAAPTPQPVAQAAVETAPAPQPETYAPQAAPLPATPEPAPVNDAPQPVNLVTAPPLSEPSDAMPVPVEQTHETLSVPSQTASTERAASNFAEMPRVNDETGIPAETAPANTVAVAPGKANVPQTAAEDAPVPARGAVPVAKADAPRVAAMLPRESRSTLKTAAVKAVTETAADSGTESVPGLTATTEPATVARETGSDNVQLSGRLAVNRMVSVQPQPLERALAQAVTALDANDAGTGQDSVTFVAVQAVTSAETGTESEGSTKEPSAKPLPSGDASTAPRLETASTPAFATQQASAHETAKTNAPERAPEPATLKTLVVHTAQNIRYLVSEGGQTITVHLEPETLGQLKIAVHTSGNDVSVTLTAANAAVRDTLEARMPQLREALSRDGISTGKVEISTEIGQPMANAGGQSSSQWAAQQQQGNARSMSWNLPRSPFRDTTPVFTTPRRGSVHDGALNLFA